MKNRQYEGVLMKIASMDAKEIAKNPNSLLWRRSSLPMHMEFVALNGNYERREGETSLYSHFLPLSWSRTPA